MRNLRLVIAAVLAVAAFAAFAQGRFQVSADGQEVTDTTTRLVWKRCVEGMSFDGKGCKGKATPLSFRDAAKKTGTGGWRMPTRAEWAAMIDPDPKKRPRLDATAFPQSPSLPSWARRVDSGDDLNQWAINTSTGKVTANLGQKKFALRLVKNGA